MKLNEVFKNTNHGDSLFTTEEVSAVNARICVKSVKGRDTPYITCFVREKEIKLTPEEAVRQLYIHRLIHAYGYAKSRLRTEYPVNFGREIKRADIVISDKDKPDAAYIVVEIKKPKLKDGKEQLKSYTNATGAPIAVWTNGEQISAYNRRDPNYFEAITDIPKASEKLADVLNERVTYDALKKLDKIANERRTLRGLIEEMEDEVLANAGVDSFEEVFKLLFSKLYDELIAVNDPGYCLRFRNAGDTDDELKVKIEALFTAAKLRWEGIFTDSDRIALTPSHLSICVATLQDVKLFDNNLDVVDDAFEYLMNKTSKGEKGQYFTPRYVIDMCVKMMNPREHENIIDTAAGSSGFTVHGIFHVWNAIRDELKLPRSTGFTAGRRTERETVFVRDHVFAIDFDEKAVRVARTLNLIAGDGQSNVLHLNTLDYGRWDEVTKQRSWLDNYNEGFKKLKKIRPNPKGDDYGKFDFDLLMANPPFAGNIKEGTILARYDFGRSGEGKMQSSVGRDILFVERNLNFLKPGGRMAIVLPQGRLNNGGDKRIRDYIAERCRILAVVGLHGNVFKPHTGTKTSVLFVQKWDEKLCPRRDDYPIFFATMQKPSKDNRGDKIYRLVDTESGLPFIDPYGHLVVDHDLFNHEGLTEDGIAEAFILFAKRENLSFFVHARPFDADRYAALMVGLEASEVMLSHVMRASDIMRLDGFYFTKEFLSDERTLEKIPHKRLRAVVASLRSFGAYSLNNEVVYREKGIPFIRCVNMRNGAVDFTDVLYIDDAANKLLWKSEIFPRTVMLSMSGSVGNVAMAEPEWTYPINSNQDIAKIVFDKEYNPVVAYLFLMTRYGRNFMRREARGSVQQHVFLSQIENIRLPVFSAGFIAELENTVDEIKAIRSDASALYASAESILLDALGLRGFAPETGAFAIKNLSESFGASGRLDAEYFQEKYELLENALHTTETVRGLCNVHDGVFVPRDGEYKYIELADIGSSGNIVGCTFAPFDALPSRARRLVKRGQVIVSSVEGSLSSCALVSDDYDGAICSTGFYVVDSDKIDSETLLVLFKSAPIQALMKKRCSGTILTAISKAAFENMPLPVIAGSVRSEIAARVRRSFALRRRSERLLDEAKRVVELAIEDGEAAAGAWLTARREEGRPTPTR
jgi:type I restriction enzyme M protein